MATTPYDNDGSAAYIGVGGSSLNTSLMRLLECDDIQPGADAGYTTCKEIFISHPLGAKMAEGPISLAQSQAREISVQEAPPEVKKAFQDEWESLMCDSVIHNLMTLSRVYGVATLGILIENEKDSSKPLDLTKIWDQNISFNVWDPLNTSGSLVLNQIPTAFDFNKAPEDGVVVNGKAFHRTRKQVMMNESPIYLAYTSSAFGFVGRSVYQRALFPLKSFLQTMIADDMIARKLGLIIAKQKGPGSVVNRVMQLIAGMKRNLLKYAVTNNVLTIDIEEEATTFDMQNVDVAGTYARTNIIRNCETAADMPAKMLDQETLSSGLADGTEDARIIARFIERIRMKMSKPYKWMDNIVQYRAWSPAFHQLMVTKYKDEVPPVYEDAFSKWRENFAAEWPSLLIEPESELIKVEQTKLEGIVALLQTLLPELDPQNKLDLIQTAMDNISENKRMFPHEFTLDADTLLEQLETKQEQDEEQANTEMDVGASTAEKNRMPPPQKAKALPKIGRV